MTREEAIKNLNMISIAFVDPVTREQRKLINDTFDMAIKALEQEQDMTIAYLMGKYEDKEPCDDTISRTDAIDQMEQSYNILDATDRIKALPSVTPSRRKGHWILADEQNKEDVENDNYRFICSECQCSDIHAKGTIVPYCWKCGAEMESEE